MELTIQTSVIRDGISWIVDAEILEFGVKLPEFCVVGATEEEAFTAAEQVLRSIKIKVGPANGTTASDPGRSREAPA